MEYKPVKYHRKETLLVEAMEINKDTERFVIEWAGKDIVYASPVLEPTEDNPDGSYWQVDTKTSEGVLTCIPGDIIFKNSNGKFYPCAKDIFLDGFNVVEDKMEMYFAVIVKNGKEVKVTRYDTDSNLNDIRGFFQQLAFLYDYEKEISDMRKMFGNFDKCGGFMFTHCEVNKVHNGLYNNTLIKERRKKCAENCPRKVPDCEEFLRQYVNDTIIIISAERGEIWRNR